MNGEKFGKPKIKAVNLQATDRCNLSCPHCYLGDAGETDMTLPDAEIAVSQIADPELKIVCVTGGEARVHHSFPDFSRTLAEGFKKAEKAPDFGMRLFTNGVGMNSRKNAGEILHAVRSFGYDKVSISVDPSHVNYIKGLNTKGKKLVDYNVLPYLINGIVIKDNGAFDRIPEIPAGLSVGAITNGPYVIPVGNARNYSWSERLDESWEAHLGETFKVKDQSTSIYYMRAKLDEEFNRWGSTYYYSHCYCSPALFRRDAGKNRMWDVIIRPDLTVTDCVLEQMPVLGSLKVKNIEELYNNGMRSKLYQIMDEEGPHGLTRRLTGLDGEKLHVRFLDRTPCGMCEDLRLERGDDLKALLEERVK